MSSRYELITYQESEKSLLHKSELSELDYININKLTKELEGKSYASVIKDIYILYKNGYSTSQLASIYNLSQRQMQRIIKEMDLTSKLPKNKRSNTGKDEKKISTNPAPSPTFFDDYFMLPRRLVEYLNYLDVIKLDLLIPSTDIKWIWFII